MAEHSICQLGRTLPQSVSKKIPFFQLGQGGTFEQGKVPGVVLFVVIQIHGLAKLNLGEIDAREFAVVWKFGNIKIDRAVFLVGVALVKQLVAYVDHIQHVLGGLRIAGRLSDAQRLDVREKSVDIFLGELLQVHLGLVGTLDGVVVQIGKIHVGGDLVAPCLEIAHDQIRHHEAPAHGQTGRFIRGRAA
jgi:hypothetical protein